MRRSLAVFSLATALLLSACGGCSKKQAAEGAGRFFPSAPTSYLSVPRPLSLMDQLTRIEESELAGLLASLGGADSPSDFVRPFERQLGFHPLRRVGFEEAGLSAERELAMGSDEEERWLLALPVENAAKARRWLDDFATRRGGQTQTERRYEAEGRSERVVAFLAPSGEIRLAYALQAGYALVAEGAEAVEIVGSALSRPHERSLLGGSLWRRTQERLGESRDLIAWFPQDEGKNKKHSLVVGLRTQGDALDLRLLFDRGFWEMGFLEALRKQAGAELLPLLSSEDFLVLRLGADPAEIGPALGFVFRSSLRQLRAAGVDPVGDLLSQLRPGVVLGIDLEPEPDLSAGLPSATGFVRSQRNPFDFFRTSIVGQVRDPVKAREGLEKIVAAAEKLSIEVETAKVGEVETWTIRYAAGEGLRLALVGDRLIAAGGSGSFESLLERAQGKASPARSGREAAAWAAFERGASAAYLDMPLLTSKLNAVPESAFGIGGFRLKALLERWTAILGELRSVGLSVGADQDGLVVDAVFGLQGK